MGTMDDDVSMNAGEDEMATDGGKVDMSKYAG
jgi:hypothetical protein